MSAAFLLAEISLNCLEVGSSHTVALNHFTLNLAKLQLIANRPVPLRQGSVFSHLSFLVPIFSPHHYT